MLRTSARRGDIEKFVADQWKGYFGRCPTAAELEKYLRVPDVDF